MKISHFTYKVGLRLPRRQPKPRRSEAAGMGSQWDQDCSSICLIASTSQALKPALQGSLNRTLGQVGAGVGGGCQGRSQECEASRV